MLHCWKIMVWNIGIDIIWWLFAGWCMAWCPMLLRCSWRSFFEYGHDCENYRKGNNWKKFVLFTIKVREKCKMLLKKRVCCGILLKFQEAKCVVPVMVCILWTCDLGWLACGWFVKRGCSDHRCRIEMQCNFFSSQKSKAAQYAPQ